MGLTLSLVVDNSSFVPFEQEHGLAIWIEIDGRSVLFDTGAGKTLELHAKLLGLDFSALKAVAISHGHYDHTGGLEVLARYRTALPCFLHPEALRTRYSIRANAVKDVSMPQGARNCLLRGEELRPVWTSSPTRVVEGVYVTGEIPRITFFEDVGGPFYLDSAGHVPDPLIDDQALVVEHPAGLLVCVGCAHAGLINTLLHVQRLWGTRPHFIIGGFHLLNASRPRIEQTAALIKSFNPELVVPCHCTGKAGVEALRKALGGRVVSGCAGYQLAL